MQLNKRTVFVAAFLALMGMAATNAQAQTPPPAPLEMAVSFNIHADPADPETPIVWSIDFALLETSDDGNDIGWAVTQVTLTQYDANEDPLNVWIDDEPQLGTTDGLWWVTHADPAAPVLEEFAVMPPIDREAVSQDPNMGDLAYVLAGTTYNPPPEGGPFETTASGDFVFTLYGEADPETEGYAEVMEVLPTKRPPPN